MLLPQSCPDLPSPGVKNPHDVFGPGQPEVSTGAISQHLCDFAPLPPRTVLIPVKRSEVPPDHSFEMP